MSSFRCVYTTLIEYAGFSEILALERFLVAAMTFKRRFTKSNWEGHWLFVGRVRFHI